MLVNVDKLVKKNREDLKQQKDELQNLENQLMVEERVLVELKEKKDELAETQKYIVMAVHGEIEMQKDKINELETDIKLLAKKCEVLNRDWYF